MDNATENRPVYRIINTLIILVFIALGVALYNTLAGRSPQEAGDAERHERAVADVKMLGAAVEKYTADKKQFPRRLEELVPQYLKSVPRDPYNKRYKLVDGGHQVWVFYYGKDGKPKGYTPMDIDVAHTVTLTDALSKSSRKQPNQP